jgi:hypothetical protein
MFTKTLATATASALLAGGAVAYTGAAAETHSTAKKSGPPSTMGDRHAKVAERTKARQAELAQRLGVSADQLTQAQAAMLKRNLDVRVAKGTLTSVQRSAILACKAAPLTCDRTNLPARAKSKKALAKRAAKRKQNAAKRIDTRAQRLGAALSLDPAKVKSALEAQRMAHHK